MEMAERLWTSLTWDKVIPSSDKLSLHLVYSDEFAPYMYGSVLICLLLQFAIFPFLSAFIILPERYKTFSSHIQSDWDNRLLSTSHALLVFSLGFYTWACDDDVNVDPFFSTSTLPRINAAIFVGYFLADLIILCHRQSVSQVKSFIVHHLVGAYVGYYVIFWGALPWLSSFRVLSEISTPFVNLRLQLEHLGFSRRSKPYLLNGCFLAISFVLIRVACLPYYYWKIASAYIQLQSPERLTVVHELVFILLCNFVADLLNFYWTYRLAMAVSKLFRAQASARGGAAAVGVEKTNPTNSMSIDTPKAALAANGSASPIEAPPAAHADAKAEALSKGPITSSSHEAPDIKSPTNSGIRHWAMAPFTDNGDPISDALSPTDVKEREEKRSALTTKPDQRTGYSDKSSSDLSVPLWAAMTTNAPETHARHQDGFTSDLESAAVQPSPMENPLPSLSHLCDLTGDRKNLANGDVLVTSPNGDIKNCADRGRQDLGFETDENFMTLQQTIGTVTESQTPKEKRENSSDCVPCTETGSAPVTDMDFSAAVVGEATEGTRRREEKTRNKKGEATRCRTDEDERTRARELIKMASEGGREVNGNRPFCKLSENPGKSRDRIKQKTS